jgi:hypothetical protein
MIDSQRRMMTGTSQQCSARALAVLANLRSA